MSGSALRRGTVQYLPPLFNTFCLWLFHMRQRSESENPGPTRLLILRHPTALGAREPILRDKSWTRRTDRVPRPRLENPAVGRQPYVSHKASTRQGVKNPILDGSLSCPKPPRRDSGTPRFLIERVESLLCSCQLSTRILDSLRRLR